MTTNEKYKKAVDTVVSSRMHKLEASDIMGNNNNKKANFRFRGVAVVLAAVILLIGVCGAAYAADVGGIQSKVQVWIKGELTDATLEISEDGKYSSYTMAYTDENGETVKIEGGGMAADIFGRERPLTEEEILEHLNQPDVEYRDDGTVWVHSGDQSVEITDKFDENGICYVKLTNGGKNTYVTVRYQDGFSTSGRKFIIPKD